MRADARRSRAKLLEAATVAFAEHGADAPLDDIARRAGVGIGTLYRHFPARVDLQAAVYRSQVQTVCDTADELISTVTAEQAFAGWVTAIAGYLVTKRGLSSSLISNLGKDSELLSSCWMAMRDAADRLLTHAQEAGVVRTDITADDVLRLVHGIVVTTERSPESTGRLLSLILDGLRPREKGGDGGKWGVEAELRVRSVRPDFFRRPGDDSRTRWTARSWCASTRWRGCGSAGEAPLGPRVRRCEP
jgi:AcrR family transcriptional regulator